MKTTRIAAATLLAGGLILGPSVAAFAATSTSYEAPGVSATVSVIAPNVGQTFVFVINANVANVTLTISSATAPSSAITIAGTKSLTKATVNGTATYDVTLTDPATYTLVATDPATGAVLASQAVTVSAAGGGSSTGALAGTGSNETPIIAGAAALVVLGAGGVLVARRRHAHQG
jgi:hypothetical protein